MADNTPATRAPRFWAKPYDMTRPQGDPRVDPLTQGVLAVVDAKLHDATVLGLEMQLGARTRELEAERQAHNLLKNDAWNLEKALRQRITELEEHNMRLGQGEAERYWEERWRTESAHTTALQSELKALREERSRWQDLLKFTEVPGPDTPSELERTVAMVGALLPFLDLGSLVNPDPEQTKLKAQAMAFLTRWRKA